jgi:sugar fermentation stimulation protein A
VTQRRARAPLLVLPHRAPLVRGRLLGRYNRFLADVQLDDGRVVTAHCVNTGRMEGLTGRGSVVWLSPAPAGRARRLAWTWEISEKDGVMVGTNTAQPNRIVGELLARRILPGLDDWQSMVAERRLDAHNRVDFWLEGAGRQTFIEVKNCHLVYPDGRGYFPDSVSTRAARHMGELAGLVAAGHRAVVIFTAQRADTVAMRPSDAHDPEYAAAARAAAAAGVEFRAVRIRPTPAALEVIDEIPVELEPYDVAAPADWRVEGRGTGPAWGTTAPPPLEG